MDSALILKLSWMNSLINWISYIVRLKWHTTKFGITITSVLVIQFKRNAHSVLIFQFSWLSLFSSFIILVVCFQGHIIFLDWMYLMVYIQDSFKPLKYVTANEIFDVNYNGRLLKCDLKKKIINILHTISSYPLNNNW